MKKPIKILLDDQMFSFQKYGGITRYFASLYDSSLIQNIKMDIAIKFTDNEYLLTINRDNKASRLVLINKSARKIVFRTINRLLSIYMLLRGNYDLFIPTYYNPYYIKLLRKAPHIITIHDMIYELYFPSEIKITERKKACILNADHIIAISEKTKQDLIQYYPSVAGKITVIYHGYKTTISNLETNYLNPFGAYVLFVGKRDDYKNFTFTIESISKYLLENNIKLICVGGGKFREDELIKIQSNGISDICIQIDVDEKDMPNYYKNANFFIYPSEYEGFGIPILEAFANRCPVILSKSSCFPEIANDAALYFKLNSKDELLAACNLLTNNEDFRINLINKGSEQLKKYSWQNTLEKTISTYQMVIKKHNDEKN